MPDDLVQKRLHYIERQRELHKEAVDVQFRGLHPSGSGPANRDGMPKLPVGQHQVRNWPVLDLGDVPHVSLADWRLEVGGLVEHPFTLTLGRVHGAAAGRRHERLPLRDHLVQRQVLELILDEGRD